MDDIHRVFIHGLEGSSRGTKGSYFHEKYPKMMINDYTGELDRRMEQLTQELAGKDNLILVGSSFGGLMAAIFGCTNKDRIRRLVLLAPALSYIDFGTLCHEPLDIPVTLYQGSDDNVVLPGPTHEVATTIFAKLDYRLVKDDHSLLVTFPQIDWDELLETGRD